jgi:TPR repeat protein
LVLASLTLIAKSLLAATVLPVGRAEDLAKAALNDRDASALHELKRDADAGDPAAQYGLALYDFAATSYTVDDPTAGNGIALAYTLIQASAAQGLPAAEYRLCRLLGRKGSWPNDGPKYDPRAAASWCERASGDGIAAANYWLAQLALDDAYPQHCPSPSAKNPSTRPDGSGRSCRNQVAISRLRQAALAGMGQAQYRLGRMLRTGSASARATAEGAHWLLLAAARANLDEEDPWDGNWVRGPAWAAPPAECKASTYVPIQQTDLPAPADMDELAQCDSEQLYYGIGQPANFVKARQCAYLERPEYQHGNGGGAAAFAGPSILMMVYANGDGVARNSTLAEKLACEMRGAPAEMTSRLEHLHRVASESSSGRIDICDDTTSGEMVSECTAREAAITGARRQAHFKEIRQRLTLSQRRAFDTLFGIANRFISAQAAAEVDQSGTGRAGFVIEQEEKSWKTFESLLAEVTAHPLAPVAKSAPGATRAKLHTALDGAVTNPDLKHQEIMSGSPFGTVRADDIREVQRTWGPYRKAWIEFYETLYPDEEAAPIDVMISVERIEQLRSFAGN